MGMLMKNGEFRGTAARLMGFMAVAAAALVVLCVLQAQWLQGMSTDQFASALGKLAAAHPELEREIVAAFVTEPDPTETKTGRALLAAYGYSASTPLDMSPVMGSALNPTLLAAFAFIALCAAGVLFLTARGYSVVYRKVISISEAAEKVVDGDFNVLLPAVGEGDFEVLGHRFNQMANRLKRNVEQLIAEKVFLKNTISDISHQLKTPLSTLIVYNDLMTEQRDMDTAQRLEFLELGRQQLHRLEWLIQSLLKMARLEAGSITFMKKPLLLRSVADAAAEALRTAAAEACVTVTIEERHAGAGIAGDEEWLTEAAINIVKNAVEHSRPGGTVTITLDHSPLTASMQVADRGSGIDPNDLPHIFERFYRGARSVKPNSIGIGLAMSKVIVEGQGGTISVRSEPGRGSEFSVVFLKTLAETKF